MLSFIARPPPTVTPDACPILRTIGTPHPQPETIVEILKFEIFKP